MGSEKRGRNGEGGGGRGGVGVGVGSVVGRGSWGGTPGIASQG